MKRTRINIRKPMLKLKGIYKIYILKLCLATATHNFKWVINA